MGTGSGVEEIVLGPRLIMRPLADDWVLVRATVKRNVAAFRRKS
jgi:hypothetical protein